MFVNLILLTAVVIDSIILFGREYQLRDVTTHIVSIGARIDNRTNCVWRSTYLEVIIDHIDMVAVTDQLTILHHDARIVALLVGKRLIILT